MKQSLWVQNVVAVIWDFDKTLTPEYMQAPLFQRFKIDEKKFWEEANGLAEFYRSRGAVNVSKDTLYLNHILTYVREGKFPKLSNSLLRELGAEINFYPGLPEFLDIVKKEVSKHPDYSKHNITVEHYVVSTGIRKMIEGSRLAPYLDGIWGCEFVQGTAKPGYRDKGQSVLFDEPDHITDIAYAIDNTTKTRALFEISKGSNKHEEIDVNATVSDEDRRVPFQHMIYIADGPSDVPAFSIVNSKGGRTFGVYKAGKMDQFAQVNKLLQEKRVQGIGEANYVGDTLAAFWIRNAIKQIADQMVLNRQAALRDRVGSTPGHILTDIKPLNESQAVADLAKIPKKPSLSEAAPPEMLPIRALTK